jgi:hypothetical protein
MENRVSSGFSGHGFEKFWVTGLRRKSRRRSIGKSGLTDRVTGCIGFSFPGLTDRQLHRVYGSLAHRKSAHLASLASSTGGSSSDLCLLLGLSHTLNLSALLVSSLCSQLSLRSPSQSPDLTLSSLSLCVRVGRTKKKEEE